PVEEVRQAQPDSELEELIRGVVRERVLVPSRDGEGLLPIDGDADDAFHHRQERAVLEVPSQLGVERDECPAGKIDDDERLRQEHVHLRKATAREGTAPGELPRERKPWG